MKKPHISYHTQYATLLKYFFSYFIILSILILGFFFAVRFQLKNIYFQTLDNQIQERLTLIQKQFNDNITRVNELHSHLVSDINLTLSRYENNDWSRYQASRRINEYAISNNFIQDIIYIDRKKNEVLSSGKYVKYKDGSYFIYVNQKFIELPVGSYGHSGKNQFLYLSKDGSNLLLYFPIMDSSAFDTIYVINKQELQTILRNGLPFGIVSICLSDVGQNIITAVNTNEILPYLDINKKEKNYNERNSKEATYALSTSGNLLIVALSSKETLIKYVDTAFQKTYLILVCIGSIGILLILWAMKLTYWPLHLLTKKVVEHPMLNGNYVEGIDRAFTSVLSENRLLQNKIDHYRVEMQKSILDSIITENNRDSTVGIADIDQLFNMEPGSYIFVVKVMAKYSSPVQKFQNFITKNLSPQDSCLTLEVAKHYAVFLIYYSGYEQYKDEVLNLLFHDLHEETGYYIAVSNSSPSPLTIPILYENASLASSYWNENPVVSYGNIESQATKELSYSYPYRKLDNLTQLLLDQNFTDARTQMGELLNSIDKENFPEFFIHCILIDILAMYVNVMNRLNVKFKSYSDIYFEALYFCRSCAYEEKKEEIFRNIYQMIDISETELLNTAIHSSQIRQLVMDNYTSPDFSISGLADSFHVSIAYMSYLFKKKFNQNFSDFLWELRLHKAEDLLKNTDMSIDNISISVGYLNTSSFRRKFKQATGITPSQYRNRVEKAQELN